MRYRGIGRQEAPELRIQYPAAEVDQAAGIEVRVFLKSSLGEGGNSRLVADADTPVGRVTAFAVGGEVLADVGVAGWSEDANHAAQVVGEDGPIAATFSFG